MSWRIVPLGDVVDIKGGGTPDKTVDAYWNGPIPWASVKDFKSTELSATGDTITQSGLDHSASTLVPAGTIIVTTRMAVGKAAIATVDLAINQDLKALFPRAGVDTRYLLHVLLSSAEKLVRFATGATVQGITLDVLRSLKIPLPPFPEQRRIAAILDQADALRRLRRDSLVRVTDLRRSIFHTHQISLNIPHQPLSMFCDKITDGTHQAPRWAESGVPFIFVSNVRNQTVSLHTEKFVSEDTYQDLTRHTSIDAGDVLYTCVGSYGHAALAPSETFLFQRHIAHLKPGGDRMLPEYLVELLESPGVRRQADLYATGIAQKTVTLATLKAMQVQVPSLDQQQQVVDKLRQVKDMESQQGRMLEGANALFTSLQHRAFRGDL